MLIEYENTLWTQQPDQRLEYLKEVKMISKYNKEKKNSYICYKLL